MPNSDKANERVTQLIKAVKKSDEEAVFNWLSGDREGIDENEHLGDKFNALHHASLIGSVAIVRMLLLAGADVNSRSGNFYCEEGVNSYEPGQTALMRAAIAGNNEIITLLLSAGADPHITDSSGWSALEGAAISGDCRIAKQLMDLDVDVNTTSCAHSQSEELGNFFMYSTLHCAAFMGHAEMVECLLNGGADVNVAWVDKRTPLFYAAAKGHANVIRVLCKHGVDPNSREEVKVYGCFCDRTPLHYAAEHRHFEAAIALLDYGAEPRMVDSNTKSNALEIAEGSYEDAKKWFSDTDPDEVTNAHKVLEAIKKKMKL